MFQSFFGDKGIRTAFCAVVLCASAFLYAHQADAALLYFNPDGAELYRGDSVKVALRLDTDEGECVNTISGVIHYDPTINAIDVTRGNSILSLWVEEPVIDESAHTISFAGGLPGGYCGRIPGDPSLTNVLLEVIFRSPGLQIGGGSDAGSARIWLDESTQALLHDGQATPAPLVTQESNLTLLTTAGGAPQDPWRDTIQSDEEPPADFSITLTKDDTAFSGKYFIVFNSTDKQSGIDHYEVMEEPFEEFSLFKWGRADAPWHVTESPYVLKDQTLNSTILVKAIDKAGNERLVRLVPDSALRGISQATLLLVLVIAGLGVIGGAIAAYFVWRKRQRAPEVHETE